MCEYMSKAYFFPLVLEFSLKDNWLFKANTEFVLEVYSIYRREMCNHTRTKDGMGM